jgi:hypothetical protein
MLTGSFLIAPTALSVPLRSYRMLAYHDGDQSEDCHRIRSFGAWFEPRCIVGAGRLDQ